MLVIWQKIIDYSQNVNTSQRILTLKHPQTSAP
jgi:hypothetical protein